MPGSTTNLSRASNYFTGPGSPPNRQQSGSPFTPLALLNLGTPTLATTTFIVNAQAVAGAGNVATLANTTLDVPRALRCVSSNAGDTTQTVLITGTDLYGQALSQLFTLNGTTSVVGTKAFKTVATVYVSAALAGNLSVGNTSVLGLPVRVDAGNLVASKFGTNTADTGTLVPAVTTNPATTTTGDVRGTFTPSNTLDGTSRVSLTVAPNLGYGDGLDADAAAYGVTQA